LAVDHLTKRFGERVAFVDFSFEVGYGVVFGFLGPKREVQVCRTLLCRLSAP
jgi:ABC-type uncharacterized transport system ATPase subunit